MTCRLRYVVEIETRCRILIWRTFGRIQCMACNPRATCHTANRFSPYFIYLFLFLMQFGLWRAAAFVSSPIHVRAFCHCVSSVTVVLWQKRNLTNKHLIFQNKIGVILCENNWRYMWHIIQHTALASSYWTTKIKGYGFYWPTLYSNCGRICSRLWDIQCQRMAWPWKPG